MFKKAMAIIAAITLSCSALPAMEHLTESGTGSMLTASAAGSTADYGTVWVQYDTYYFTKTLEAYKDRYMTQQNPNVKTVSAGDKRVFVDFYHILKNGKEYVVGKTQAGSYIPLSENGILSVKAYVTINVSTLNVRVAPASGSMLVGQAYYGQTVRITKTNGDWGYSPNLGGWINLEYVIG